MNFQKPYGKIFTQFYEKIMDDKFYRDYYLFVSKIFIQLKFKPIKILELACGTGKLAKLFSDKGYTIDGLDTSKYMLELAEKKGIRCYRKNMVKFNLPERYDLILSIYDSLNYLKTEKDLERCFGSVKTHLNLKGLFIFDMNSDYKINTVIPKIQNRYYKIKNAELIWLNFHKTNKWVAKMILFEKTNKHYQRFYEKHIEKAYKLNIIKKLLKKFNFKILGIYSDFNFSKAQKNSLRWFFVCQKNK